MPIIIFERIRNKKSFFSQVRTDLHPTKKSGGLSLTGFTLLELLVTIVILGILATLGIVQYTSAKEKALDKEAIVGLKAIQAAQNVQKYQYGGYTGCEVVEECNSVLRLDLPTSEKKNWKYTVLGSGSVGEGYARYTAKACRTNPPAGHARYWTIAISGEPSGPVSGDGGCPDVIQVIGKG